MNRSSAPVAVFLLLLCAGCTPDEGSLQPLDVTTYALDEELTIGAGDDPQAQFAAPRVVGTDGTGAFYVFDLQAEDLRRFNHEGELEAVLWSTGRGPLGGLRPGSILVEARDRVRLSDARGRRIAWIDSLGVPAGSVDLEAVPGTAVGVLALDDPAGFIALAEMRVSERVEGRPVVRRSLVRFGFDGALRETLAAHEVRAPSIVLDEGSSSVHHAGLEFDAILTYFAGDALLIEQPEPESERAGLVTVSRPGPAGMRRVLEFPYRPLRLSSQTTAELRARQLRSVDRLPGGLTPARQRIIDVSLSIPEFHPPVADVMNCGDQTLWVRIVERGEENQWLVFDRELRPQSRVLLPDDVVEVSCGSDNEVWAVRRGSLDVHYLARMRRVRAPPQPTAPPARP